MTTVSDLRLAAVNERRKHLFEGSSLKVYTTTPAFGEVEVAEFTEDWFGQRVWKTTDVGVKEAGAWQFQVLANSDWSTSQSFMLTIVALTIDGRRWKVTKVEKPIGKSLMWKLKAEVQ